MEHAEKEIFERLTALESSYNNLHKRLDHIEELVESVQKMTVEMTHMREDLNTVTEKIEVIEQKPAKHWDALVSAVLGAFAGGLGTMMVTAFLGG